MHKKALLISFLSLLSAVFFNEYNLSVINKEFPEGAETRYMIGTADEASYLSPPENFLKGSGWHSNDVGSGAWVYRTPGYGSIYLLCKIIAGDHALMLLRYLQLLLFACSVYLLFLSAIALTNNIVLTIVTAVIYGALPFMQGFLYYTLTEGITPALVILFAYFLIRVFKTNTIKFQYYAAIVLAFLIIIRPQMMVLYLAFIPFYFNVKKERINYSLKTFLLTTILSFSLLLCWQLRNYQITNRWAALNAVYNPDNNSIFRPQHKAIGEFYKSFNIDGALFHQHLNLLWSHAISGDTAEKYIVDVIGGMPLNVVECLSKEQITAAFKLYQQCSFEQKYFTENKIPMPLTRRINEEKCVNAFEQLTSTYSKNFPLETTLLIPLKAYWKMAVHSNLSLHIFQHEWKGKFWMEALRWLCLIIHVSLFTFFLLQLFIGMDKLTALLLFVPMVYFFYLCYFQVMLEERYTLPMIPLLILGTAKVFQYLIKRFKHV